MDALEAILSRRSIRKYTNQPVSEETINTLLQAAMTAPSGKNEQPWAFVVINERQILDKIPEFHEFATMLPQAPLAILVCGESDREPEFWKDACCAAAENILIAANALGLGAVWLAVYPLEERVKGIRKLVNLPENMSPLCLIPIGYPEFKKKAATDRFNTSKIHYNLW